ncbi:hypothetical protein GLOTRDRAFT_122782 [Gloeophyllum trabeum ATCC 11539]|uniref:MYND-type domain-containing protein n=1 Tax=Gloeophyllum trabeum (strain ATCC 11539 / FP-39264 / Madison 617) TaxID=670483 RepID=S7PXM6_GLOTA|nr:uncharacterized protein GLOTRDRAFT_122782 [Gloeophyllum trabeum ATCC 11539]EPQ52052.1 hypothetical protein GLOTRDRAFT_122782 [Gloeophyllum trabeum ATCC 11539]
MTEQKLDELLRQFASELSLQDAPPPEKKVWNATETARKGLVDKRRWTRDDEERIPKFVRKTMNAWTKEERESIWDEDGYMREECQAMFEVDLDAKDCAICGTMTRNKCSRCKKVYYCTKDCQRADWKSHKPTCGKPDPAPASSPQDTSRILALLEQNKRPHVSVRALLDAWLAKCPHGGYVMVIDQNETHHFNLGVEARGLRVYWVMRFHGKPKGMDQKNRIVPGEEDQADVAGYITGFIQRIAKKSGRIIVQCDFHTAHPTDFNLDLSLGSWSTVVHRVAEVDWLGGKNYRVEQLNPEALKASDAQRGAFQGPMDRVYEW